MINVTLTISKQNVYNEVAKTTGYTGAKKEGDENAYERILTTDEDALMLERFWAEACSLATSNMKPFITSVSEQTTTVTESDLTKDYTVGLELSSSFDENLTSSMEDSLFSYFVNFITAKWYNFTEKEEMANNAAIADAMLEDVMKKIYYRKKPKRTIPNI